MSDFFDAIFGFLKKLWDILKVVIVIALIVLAIYFTMGGSFILFEGGLTLFGITFGAVEIGGALAAALALGAAFLIDPEFTADLAEDLANGIGTIAGTVSSGLVSGLVSSPLGFAIIGLGVYFLFFRGKSETASEGETLLVGSLEGPSQGVIDTDVTPGLDDRFNVESSNEVEVYI